MSIIAIATSAIITPTSAKTPSYPASNYIQDVRVGNPEWPIDFDSGGVSILLTPDGDSAGLFWNGAWTLSGWVIESWEEQSRKPWPYYWRSRESVAREIQVHCWRFDTTSRRTTISFYDDWWV